jgi:hypothetical protein
MLGRHSSAIRAACANERSCGSERGAISDGRPYRDLFDLEWSFGFRSHPDIHSVPDPTRSRSPNRCPARSPRWLWDTFSGDFR